MKKRRKYVEPQMMIGVDEHVRALNERNDKFLVCYIGLIVAVILGGIIFVNWGH